MRTISKILSVTSGILISAAQAAIAGPPCYTNTPPRFTCGPNQSVGEDAGPQSVPNWATEIAPSGAKTVFASTFDSLPPGSTTNGSAALDGGILKLTSAIAGQQGAFVTPAVTQPVQSFTATFNVLVGGGTCCGARTADGWSLSFGNDVNPNIFSYGAEEGGGSGIIVSFDSWDNTGVDDAHTAPDVDVKVGGNVIAYQAFDGVREGGRAPSGPLITDPATGNPMTYKTGTNFAPVRVHLDADGTLDVDFKGVRVINNVQTGYQPIAGARWMFGARTGGATDNHWIDDLSITAFSPVDPAEAGQTVQFLVSNDNPNLFAQQPAVSPNGTLSYTTAPKACGQATVTVVARDNGGTDCGGNDTSAPCTFTINVSCVNDCPVAVAKVTPNVQLLVGQTDTIVIAANGSNACVTLDGAMSSDPDGDALTYAWIVDGVPVAAGAIASTCLGLGTHTVTLVVDDGRCAASQTIAVDVLTPCEAEGALIILIQDSSLPRNVKQPLVTSVKSACASFEKFGLNSGVNQLQAFKNKVRTHVRPLDLALAYQLEATAQAIIDALTGP